MHTVILAGGKGTRLRPLTTSTPKPLIPVRGISIIDRTIEVLPDSVDGVTIVTQYLGHLIDDHIKKQNGKIRQHIQCVPQGDITGTYGALLCAREHIPHRFLVLNGDDLYDKSELTLLLKHERAVGVQYHTMPNHGGVIVKKGKLQGLQRPQDIDTPERLAMTGAYLLDHDFFTLKPEKLPNGEYGIPHTLAKNIDTYEVDAVLFKHWLPINTPEELNIANSMEK